MTNPDVLRIVAEFRKEYPPLISLLQAAAIAQCPLGTVYDWSSRKLFDDFKIRVGRHCLLDLVGFITFLLTRESQLELCTQVPEQAENSAAPEPAPHVNSTFNHEVD